jgi:hypothetical protein
MSEKHTKIPDRKRPVPHTAPASLDELEELRRLANAGNRDAQAALCRYIELQPNLQAMGDLAAHAEMALIRLIADDDFLVSESLRRRAAELRRELAGTSETPLERLAIQRVASTWMYLHHIEVKCAQAEGDPAAVKLWLLRQGQAANLHNAALKSLAMLRALAAPVAPPSAARVARPRIEPGRVPEPAAADNGNGNHHSQTAKQKPARRRRPKRTSRAAARMETAASLPQGNGHVNRIAGVNGKRRLPVGCN